MNGEALVELRPATTADAPQLGELAGALVRFHHELDPARFLPGDGVEDGYGKWLGKESTNPDAVVLVAEIDGVILGYAYGRYEGRNWNDLIDAHGKLHDVLVAPEGRRRGAGRLLVDAVCQKLRERGAKRVVLSTAVSNVAAQALFEGLGFRPTMIEMTRNL
ncbi:MAG: GNAT family N-acetyltransferase [Polyangiaceae bacterium]